MHLKCLTGWELYVKMIRIALFYDDADPGTGEGLMPGKGSRMVREAKTVEAMIALYCRAQHGSVDALCAECSELLDYARMRLDKCPYQESKTTCANCPTHCYQPAMRVKIRAVMRYAGPRMLLRHPLMVLMHLFDGLRKEPVHGVMNFSPAEPMA